MTWNLISLAFVPYVSLFSVICIVVLATFDHFVRLIRRKEPHVDLLPQVKTTKSVRTLRREGFLLSLKASKLPTAQNWPEKGIFIQRVT